MPRLGVPELILIIAVVLIVFGAGKLPSIGGALGKGIREFRRATRGEGEVSENPKTAEVDVTNTAKKNSQLTHS